MAEVELMTALPLADLPADDESRLAVMTDWARDRLSEARAMMKMMSVPA
jgi:hypothetical protein